MSIYCGKLNKWKYLRENVNKTSLDKLTCQHISEKVEILIDHIKKLLFNFQIWL